MTNDELYAALVAYIDALEATLTARLDTIDATLSDIQDSITNLNDTVAITATSTPVTFPRDTSR